ncbi:MAG: hypothetical protein HOE90_05040 [Bacteriovoracaceae bacterium]|nr:hypothetical protein [Bacteriovoracaceae bacterium]
MNLKIALIAAVACIAVNTGVYIGLKSVEPRFNVEASVLLKRFDPPVIDEVYEMAHNRWVWVRDGLELKHRLTSFVRFQAILKKFGKASETEKILRNLKIDFTGGDDNRYELSFLTPDKSFGINLLVSLMEQLELLAQEKSKKGLIEIEKRLTKDTVSRQLAEKIRYHKLIARTQTEVLKPATAGSTPSYPNYLLIHLLASLITIGIILLGVPFLKRKFE